MLQSCISDAEPMSVLFTSFHQRTQSAAEEVYFLKSFCGPSHWNKPCFNGAVNEDEHCTAENHQREVASRTPL